MSFCLQRSYLHVGHPGYPLRRHSAQDKPTQYTIASHPRRSRALVIALAIAANGSAFALPDEVTSDEIFADAVRDVRIFLRSHGHSHRNGNRSDRRDTAKYILRYNHHRGLAGGVRD